MILHGDCRQQLATLPDCSVDAIVTDPPYELGFMGKKWDASGIAYDPEVWSQCLRVLKPGGHLCAFGGTRTYHRMTVAIEDAGFEIRDSLHWLYGSGFPKSLDVSKAIDKRPGVSQHAVFAAHLAERRRAAGMSRADVSEVVVGTRSGACWNWEHHQFPESKWWPALQSLLGLDESWAAVVMEAEREIVGTNASTLLAVAPGEGRDRPRVELNVTTAATDAAVRWDGWGTALKPAHEPIVLARKPLTGTVAANVMEYGTGALNIDASRVGSTVETWPTTRSQPSDGVNLYTRKMQGDDVAQTTSTGAVPPARWPANVLLTHAPECETECVAGCPVATLNEQSGTTTGIQRTGFPGGRTFGGGEMKAPTGQWFGDSGGASRFFTTTEWDADIDVPFLYVAKPSRKERNAGLDGTNHHPTVKPVALIRHLIRLVTPPGGTVLDPFLGSGTTAVAAILEGFNWIGCELTDDYLPIIEARTTWAQQNRPEPDLTLFTEQP